MCADKNDFSDYYVSRAIVQAISVCVQTLSLNECRLGNQGGNAVAEGIMKNKRIKYLYLRKNNIGDPACKLFQDVFTKYNAVIEYLDLS